MGHHNDFRLTGAHQTDATISAATTLTPPAGAHVLLIQALTQNVRMTLDGTTPTASVGFRLTAGDPPTLIPMTGDMEVQVIEEAAEAEVQYQWGVR